LVGCTQGCSFVNAFGKTMSKPPADKRVPARAAPGPQRTSRRQSSASAYALLPAKHARQLLERTLGDAVLKGWTFVIAVPPARRRDAAPQPDARQSPATIERFWSLWSSGALAAPFGPCASSQLYECYRLVCLRDGADPERPLVFAACIARLPGVVARRFHARLLGQRAKQHRGYLPDGAAPPEGKQLDWFSESLDAFDRGLATMRGRQRTVTR
jgi:hypothetical protein